MSLISRRKEWIREEESGSAMEDEEEDDEGECVATGRQGLRFLSRVQRTTDSSMAAVYEGERE